MRILRPQNDRKIYYFAFGANLSPDILKQRRTTVFEMFDYELEDAALQFSQSGFYKDHGFASADPAPGEKVYGKMCLIRESDARRMDYYEAVPFIKSHDKVVEERDGLKFYYYRAKIIHECLMPSKEYLDYITTAYRKMDCVPEAYVDAMEATEVLEKFEPLEITGKYVKDINRWPTFLHPSLTWYERTCRNFVRVIWNSSLLVWMIDREK